MSNEPTPTPGGTFDNAENFIITQGDQLVPLEDLLLPGYSNCRLCALRPRGDPEDAHYIPAKCQFFDPDRHCVIEEALVIETKQSFVNDGGLENLDKFTLFSLVTNLLTLHRLSRVGQVINFSNAGIDKDASDILNKYISMSATTNNQYIKSLKEMLATRKDRMIMKLASANNSSSFIANLQKAKEIDTISAKEAVESGKSSPFD